MVAAVIMTTMVTEPVIARSWNGKTELMTQKQRRAKFASKTNPARGKKTKLSGRTEEDGYIYADFGKFNSYSYENDLGGTPIYLIGTIKDMAPFRESGNEYQLGMMVDDPDGYQWCVRIDVNKPDYEDFKSNFKGTRCKMIGIYSGYSGVMNRPMMDADAMDHYNAQNTSGSTDVVPLVAETASGDDSSLADGVTKSGGSASSGGSFDLSKAVEKGDYMLNLNNGKVHLSNCSWGPEKENRAYFKTFDDAINAGNGTSPCGHCLKNRTR